MGEQERHARLIESTCALKEALCEFEQSCQEMALDFEDRLRAVMEEEAIVKTRLIFDREYNGFEDINQFLDDIEYFDFMDDNDIEPEYQGTVRVIMTYQEYID